MSIATAGSCFAQNIGHFLKKSTLHFFDVEPPPDFLDEQLQFLYGYNIFSARYGNIYTIRSLLQLIQRSKGSFNPKEKYWIKGNGWVDPFRPTIEPKPFISPEEVEVQQKIHLEKVNTLFSSCGLLIFTLGLTEVWQNKEDGAAYPLVPGTQRGGGTFDQKKYEFVNLSYSEIMDDLISFYNELLEINPECKIILTVSPVPLVATATGTHVVSATTYSKSTLRAAAGDMASKFENIDYFPSFEIINSHIMEGTTYLKDKRTVSSFGVRMAMDIFFECYGITCKNDNPIQVAHGNDDVVLCDEEILTTFLTIRENQDDK